ncbi:contact-dependent growth inhibition system immunity protein [Nocardioides pinisoli]|uniref:Contact-dependent growth inhibition system immunity protein n=1 Tax=Nocardioides pinisoli TaxID=2950279 RepID=A0ABT1KZC6_9ACTN|nr:contact-dependent growth inhibition system immunity protein [Nocardioides pinisoli]MCP3423115.1 contact-dependent growth inhibition system immunity protein [Nocardioides pinisoli]
MEAVKYLMSAYFHQDWDLDGGAVSDTVASFLNERRDLVSSCADEIDELLQQDFPEGGLAAQLAEWGCDYFAGNSDQDYRQWLDEIRQQIRAALASSAAS